ncbi:MAG: nucleotidyl transferase AbiEii/AbiGii toxin family protein [Tannerella sp.]|jgi:predicted nucleotidyltransferase component of viral defense system|nr:nucleotidyl transferase AbiEii/AbiGii toxin family protein [Tannerella sp.]
MINLQQIKNFFPADMQGNPLFRKYMLKEYVQLLILDFLSTSVYVEKIAFIGDTNLRLVKGIDRFSEDLDFDCKNFLHEDFLRMTDGILVFLRRSGLRVETRDKQNDRLTAFRRNIYFPELLFDLGLSGYREERFLIKVEMQNQGFDYNTNLVNIKRLGFFFPFPVPPDNVLCAMKISALLSRAKGRDFYDAMFLMQLTEPDYQYLAEKCNIKNKAELKASLLKITEKTNLKMKSHDFEHLLFNKEKSQKILLFKDFIEGY